ncbi:DUF1415 domain-containing protein [Paraglaciecola polaris]|uniref:DUF1415 domain-containing protein n=1 Tax=Paraglaciecola polaris LMG 21857 TaxID=1129793 RepID=K6ZTE6_9ALTE|nr:DUF1415 domain-containing protein [Paraglaciecola polaris]GAC33557.1 hypothetical protein GPLA_2659 [Paraglaciecola polaris LMG 21857]
MNNIPHNDVAIQTIQAWLSDIIIGHNFCPFAKREFERESIAYTVSRAVTLKNATDQLLTELHTLEQNSQIETSLLIFSTGFSDFDDYLDLVAMSQALIEGGGYAGQFQLASFHPDYCFEGEAPDDLSNYTNRAPLPILHVLRESSLDRVMRTYPDPENIPLRNIDKARQLGQMYWQQTLHRLNRPESKD